MLLSFALPGLSGALRGWGRIEGAAAVEAPEDGGGEGRVVTRKPPASETVVMENDDQVGKSRGAEWAATEREGGASYAFKEPWCRVDKHQALWTCDCLGRLAARYKSNQCREESSHSK